jgi:cytochrome c oxidase assembly factor CtaG
VHPYTWSLHAEVVVLVPILAAAYALLLRRFPADGRRVTFFLGGLAMILVVFVTPLENLALHYLLTAHLLQNVVLAEWAPALLVLGLPAAAIAAPERNAAFRAVTRPLVALPVWLATYYAWHVPAAYDTALRNAATLLHLEHLCYLVTGLLLWWPVLARRLAPGAAAAYLFAAFVLISPLGLLLALIPHAVYDFYVDAPRLWSLTPLGDQQLAGLTMAAEEAIVFFGAFAVYFARFMRQEDSALMFKEARWTK